MTICPFTKSDRLFIKLVIVAFPLSTQHLGERAKTGWIGIRIMCPSGVTFLLGLMPVVGENLDECGFFFTFLHVGLLFF